MALPTPARQFPPELLLAAQGVKVAFFDVDGVMTDGGILYSDEGETLMDVEGRTRDSVLLSALRPNEYPAEDHSAVELSIDPASFRQAFAGDLPESETAVMSATQRPIAESSFAEKSGPPAWRKLPSWAVVATGDKTIGTDVVKSMAQRAGAKVTEVEASHVVMISHPDVVADVVRTAYRAVSGG